MDRPASIRDRLRALAASALALAAGGIALYFALIVPMVSRNGWTTCRRAARAEFPELVNDAEIVSTVWTRLQGNHWIAALLLQPHDLSSGPFTLVCHFVGTNHAHGTVEFYAGDIRNRVKAASIPLFYPDAWFK